MRANSKPKLLDDGVDWEVLKCRDSRYCKLHETDEFLLQFESTVHPAAFFAVANAGEKLELTARMRRTDIASLLEQNGLGHDQVSQCNTRPWDQIHQVLRRRRGGSRLTWDVEWKLLWTPIAMVNNQKWARAEANRWIKRYGHV